MKNIPGLSDLTKLILKALPPDTAQAMAELLEDHPEIFVAGCQVKHRALERVLGGHVPANDAGFYDWFEIAIAWYFTQNVATFDSDFATELCKTSFTNGFPVRELERLLGNPVYIPLDTPKDSVLGYVLCVDMAGWNDTSKKTSGVCARLDFMPVHSFDFLKAFGFILEVKSFGLICQDGGETEPDALKETIEYFKDQVLDDSRVAEEIINKIVYMLSDEPEAIEWRHEVLDFVPQIRKHKRRASTIYAPRQPRVKRFGESFGTEIRQASAAMGTDRSVRPHIRSAHWHTYLVGEGRTKRVIRWLKPIFVHSRQAEPAATRIPAY